MRKKRIDVSFRGLGEVDFSTLLETIKTIVASRSNTCEYSLKYGDDWGPNDN